LADVRKVADHVVIIESGQALVSAPTSEVLKPPDELA
jgi:hypothetical protein